MSSGGGPNREFSSCTTAGRSVQYRKAPKCKCCSGEVFYDIYSQKSFNYCSRKCRDQDLLEDNVKETKEEILRLEGLLLAVGSPELPRPTSSHDCGKWSIGRIFKPPPSKRSCSSSTVTTVATSSDSVKDKKTGKKPDSTGMKSYSSIVAGTKGNGILFYSLGPKNFSPHEMF